MWAHIEEHNYCFGYKGSVGVEMLKKITKAEMIDFYREIFIDEECCMSFEIHVTAEMHKEEQEKERAKKKEEDPNLLEYYNHAEFIENRGNQ